MKVVCPEFDLVQKGSPGSLQATVTATVSILGLVGIAEVVENIRFSCQMGSC